MCLVFLTVLRVRLLFASCRYGRGSIRLQYIRQIIIMNNLLQMINLKICPGAGELSNFIYFTFILVYWVYFWGVEVFYLLFQLLSLTFRYLFLALFLFFLLYLFIIFFKSQFLKLSCLRDGLVYFTILGLFRGLVRSYSGLFCYSIYLLFFLRHLIVITCVISSFFVFF